MLNYIGRRLMQIIPLLAGLSMITFAIIQAPPGDYVTVYIQALEMAGTKVSENEILSLRRLYNLDRPVYMQYLIWIRNIVLRGDFGRRGGGWRRASSTASRPLPRAGRWPAPDARRR